MRGQPRPLPPRPSPRCPSPTRQSPRPAPLFSMFPRSSRSMVRLCSSRFPLAAALSCGMRQRQGRVLLRESGGPGGGAGDHRRGGRAADHALHPRHRNVRRRGAGRRRRRNAGACSGHAGRARHAGGRGRRTDPDFVGRGIGAGRGSRGQRGADREPPGARRRRHVRHRSCARGGQRPRHADARAGRLRPRRCCSRRSCCRRPSSTNAAPRRSDATPDHIARNAAVQQYQALLGRGRGSRWRARRLPTRSCGRPLPAWSPNGWSRWAIT